MFCSNFFQAYHSLFQGISYLPIATGVNWCSRRVIATTRFFWLVLTIWDSDNSLTKMWTEYGHVRGNILGREDAAKSADARLRGENYRQDAVDPVGCVTADFSQSVAEGLDPYKTVNEFLDHGDCDYGTQMFGRAGHRFDDRQDSSFQIRQLRK